ncbi:MAG: hypothetical protein P4L84_14385 [Isosphaeraceae bacterium]|nr:hypothetical protein [Isosphaeraceae bacterium]
MTGLLARADREERLLVPVSSSRVCSRLSIGISLAGLALLTAVAALSRAPLVYDEAPYLKPVALLHHDGLSLRFLHDYPEPAGLLHNVLHWVLEPLTGLKPPGVRLVNPVLLGLTILVSFLTLRLLVSEQPLGNSLAIIAIPSIWTLTGMVLTEMPAIFLTSLSVYLLLLSRQIVPGGRMVASTAALVGGMMLGAAFLSRASVLVVLGALPCLALTNWRSAAAYALGALLVAGPIIGYWGGLVPPQSVVPVATSSISAYNTILSVCYAATMMLILAPRWFDVRARWALPLVGAIILLNALTGVVEIPVLRSTIARLPEVFARAVPRLAGGAMLALASLFLFCSLKHIYVRRHDPVWLFLCFAMLLLIVSPGKITHQFSSRYTGMAAGLMVLASAPFAASVPWAMAGQVIGMLIGLASLLSYYGLAGN